MSSSRGGVSRDTDTKTNSTCRETSSRLCRCKQSFFPIGPCAVDHTEKCSFMRGRAFKECRIVETVRAVRFETLCSCTMTWDKLGIQKKYHGKASCCVVKPTPVRTLSCWWCQKWQWTKVCAGAAWPDDVTPCLLVNSRIADAKLIMSDCDSVTRRQLSCVTSNEKRLPTATRSLALVRHVWKM